jgi:hypothetical protein
VRIKAFLIFLAIVILAPSCTGPEVIDNGDHEPVKYNVRFIGLDVNIDNPEKDRRCYYKVYINKADEGRTTTGLESQKKIFETRLNPNRHLIMVEKWVLDRKAGKYRKLNNVEQPKPNFFYFTVKKGGVAVVTLNSNRRGRSEFSLEYKRR